MEIILTDNVSGCFASIARLRLLVVSYLRSTLV